MTWSLYGCCFLYTQEDRFGTLSNMDTPVRVCGRTFTPALIQHLAEMIAAQPKIGRGTLAREVCLHLNWYL